MSGTTIGRFVHAAATAGVAALLVAACGGGGSSGSLGNTTGACDQGAVDGTIAPATASYIYPRQTVTPFYQWENNNGYCGEVSMIQAGLSNGQWMSQFNARLVCGSGLSQSGPDGACNVHQQDSDFNAQLLLENPGSGVTGPNRYADAAQCLLNSRLSAATYDYTRQQPGVAGYRDFMSWVKNEVIGGHQVTLGVLVNGESGSQYDHDATVIKIGTNHSPADATYYPDDVLYIDDHGSYALQGGHLASTPAIPRGAKPGTGCTPFVYAYTFDSFANTREGANLPAAHAYSIVIPGNANIETYTGGSGYDPLQIVGPHNYAFSVIGPADSSGESLPVLLTIIGPTYSDGVANPGAPLAGYSYENPMIGTSNRGKSCTNEPPAKWMTNFGLQVTVSGLTPGTTYNLYRYDLSPVSGVGSAAALLVPTGKFNANANLATSVTTFTASASAYSTSITTTSDKIVVFRCVAANAP
ncbi:MAG TPA: hypothetical protein VMH37_04635 [Candidatus Binataceae bacterium]|nr:hypothetical protein [Candidatus Binataceae bacterium]